MDASASLNKPHRAPPNPVLLTVNETADRLRISRSKVYELLTSKRLRSVSIGRSRRIPADTVTEFVESLDSGD